jgi:hypothetical protein
MKAIFTATLAIGLSISQPVLAQVKIDYGDDAGQWANDVECDDARFVGVGMTSTPLLQSDIMHDATDCRTQFQSGNLDLRGIANGLIDFGDDLGDWANDDECDDMRFEGAGMTATILLFDDIMHDATDCKTAYDNGRLQVIGIR